MKNFFNDVGKRDKLRFRTEETRLESIATGDSPVVLTASGAHDILDGGVNGVNDTLVSAGQNTNTYFAFHKNGGNDIALNFDFGGNKDINDVVLVDDDYACNGLVKGKSGAVVIGSETQGSLTLLGNFGQNSFAYSYAGIEGIVSADMSDNGMNMSFDYNPDLYIGQGKNTSLIFENKDVIVGNDFISGFGWNSKYWGENIGTIDARNGYVAAINGDSMTDQTIYASKLVGGEGSPESVGKYTYLCGGMTASGNKFVNYTNDTLYGSENGNTAFYTGKDFGSDSVMNVVDNDVIVLLDTKWTDLAFDGLGENYIRGKASNGNVLTATSKNKLSDLNDVTILFEDRMYTAKGARFSDIDFTTAANDMIFGKGEGNETFYVGKNMGNDAIYNISSEDTVILSNTSTSDIYSRSFNDHSLGATFKNGTQVSFYSDKKLADVNNIKIQFDDITYTLTGNNTDYSPYNSANDILFGSGEGNSEFYVGKNLGNDLMVNVTSGDKVVFLDTKYTDIYSSDYGLNYAGVLFNNGTVIYLGTKNYLSEEKDVTLQFSDITLKWNGSYLVQA